MAFAINGFHVRSTPELDSQTLTVQLCWTSLPFSSNKCYELLEFYEHVEVLSFRVVVLCFYMLSAASRAFTGCAAVCWTNSSSNEQKKAYKIYEKIAKLGGTAR